MQDNWPKVGWKEVESQEQVKLTFQMKERGPWLVSGKGSGSHKFAILSGHREEVYTSSRMERWPRIPTHVDPVQFQNFGVDRVKC